MENHECKICGKSYATNVAFSGHLSQKHNISAIDYLIKYEGFVVPKCPYCGEECKRPKRGFVFASTCAKKECEYKLRRDRSLDKYGTTHPFGSKEAQKKFHETCKKKYGCDHPFKSKVVQKKREKTWMKKYGCKRPTQNKEIRAKIENTIMKHYGVRVPAQSEVVREKTKKTCLERYGVEYTAKVPEVRRKKEETCIARYGSKNPMASEQVKEKIKQTNLERYGVVSTLLVPEVQEKIRETNIEKYGAPSYSQTAEMHKRRKTKITYDGIHFDSTWELHWYKKWVAEGKTVVRSPCRLHYTYEGKDHYYMPDFMVDGQLVEIKGSQFFRNGQLINPYEKEAQGLVDAKFQCMLDNNVLIITEDTHFENNEE